MLGVFDVFWATFTSGWGFLSVLCLQKSHSFYVQHLWVCSGVHQPAQLRKNHSWGENKLERLNLAGQHLLHTAMQPQFDIELLQQLFLWCFLLGALSRWDQDKTAPVASSGTFLAGPGQGPGVRVGGQESKQVPAMVWAVLCQPLDLLSLTQAQSFPIWRMNFPLF